MLESLGVNLDKTRAETSRILTQSLQQPQTGSTSKTGSRTPTLEQLGVDLTKAAQSGKLDPTVGREKEIQRVIQILSRRTKNNPVLIGEPGVGKTVIVEGLAQRIVKAEVPNLLMDKRVKMLEMSEIIAGANMRGEFEERMKAVKDEIISAHGNIILFIDELHTIVSAGAGAGGVDADCPVR